MMGAWPGGQGDSEEPPAPARTTVAIVGAGPAGLVLGHLLERARIPFVLLERHVRTDVAGAPKAGVVEYRTVELLRAEGIAGDVVRFVHRNDCCEFRTPSESVVFDYGAMTGGRPHYIYPQHELVTALCDALVATGAEVRFGATVTGVEADGNGVSVLVAGAAGDPCAVQADTSSSAATGRDAMWPAR